MIEQYAVVHTDLLVLAVLSWTISHLSETY